MTSQCGYCDTDITCPSCKGAGVPRRGLFEDPPAHIGSCVTCLGSRVFYSHACADVFDEFLDPYELRKAIQMLSHPDIEIPGQRRVETHVAKPSLVRPGGLMRPVFAHHPVLVGQPYDSLLDGYDECPEHLGDVVYFLILRSARFVLQAQTEHTIDLRLTTEWSPEYQRVALHLEEAVRRHTTVVLHRQFIGRVC